MDKVTCNNNNVEETQLVMVKPLENSDTSFEHECMMRYPLEMLNSSCEDKKSWRLTQLTSMKT